MLPHAKDLRNVGVDSVELWLRSVSLLSKAVVFPGGISNGELSAVMVPSVSSTLGVFRTSGGRRRLMLSWKGRG
jgi:hypothetical protein